MNAPLATADYAPAAARIEGRPASPAWPRRMIDVGHSRLAHYRVGHGPDVVFVHGWPLHAATFRHVVPALAERFTCHLFDLPGTGASEWSEASDIGLVAHASSLRLAVDRLGLERFALVGHDSGAAIARLLAAELGDRITALVVANSEIPGHHPPLVALMTRLHGMPGFGAGMRAALRVPALRRSSLLFGGCFHDRSHLEGEFGALFIEPLVTSPEVFAGQMRLLAGFDWGVVDAMRETHARITAKTLLLWGVHDPFFPVAKARTMVPELAGGARLVEVEDAGLLVHEERPERFAGEVGAFLEESLGAHR